MRTAEIVAGGLKFEVARGRACRTYGAGECAFADPALTRWANLWRASGACPGGAENVHPCDFPVDINRGSKLVQGRTQARPKFSVLDLGRQMREERDCRSVELRALCNEVPRTPPGPEGSNGTGNASGAADHPKFLALKAIRKPLSALNPHAVK
jgi:hypothetical protein